MKRYLSLFLALVLVLSLVPSFGVSAAAAAPIAAEENFDSLEVGSVPGAPFTNADMATVTASGKSSNGVHLSDTSTTATATLRTAVESAEALELTFDGKGVSGAVQVHITSGVRNTANTAYWIQFSGKTVQYYDGSAWVTVKTRDVFFTAWNAVRIVADVNTAEIYIGNELMGVAQRAGGAYGTNVSKTLDSVSFLCGGVATTGNNCYIDNVRLAPVTDVVKADFEAEAVGAVPGYPMKNAAMATVVEKANGTASVNAVFLEDTSETASASVATSVKSAAALNLEYKLQPWAGAMQVYITSGARANANTAYWLQISGKNVQYYDGAAWQTIYTLENFLSKWNTVRVEATMDSAKIFINNQYMGEAKRAGGAYGTAVTDTIDTVTFVCGGAKDATAKYYIDDVKLAAVGAFSEDFDALELTGSVEEIAGYVAHKATVIKPVPGGANNKALFLGDGTANPEITLDFEHKNNYVMEFDAYIPEEKTLVSFQMHDGSDDEETDSAFILSFNFAYGLRVFGGSYDNKESQVWTDLNPDVKLTPKTWHNIRVEVSNDGTVANAVIFLDDVKVGETDIVYYKQDPMYGVKFYLGAATQSCYIDNLKVSEPGSKVEYAPSVEVDFDTLEVGAIPGAPIGATNDATVVADATKETNCVQLNDQSEKAAAYLGVSVEPSKTLELNVDAKGAKGVVQIYITNGARNTANTAYWIQFSGKNVQYYDGAAWQTLKTRDVFFTVWANVRVEADMETAKIYVNDELMGEAQRAGGSYGTAVTDTIDTVTFVCGSASATAANATGDNCYIDNLKLTGNTRFAQVTPTTQDDFDALEVGSELGAPFTKVSMATVTASGKSGNGIHMNDTSTSGSPAMSVSVAPSAELELNVDAKGASGPVQIWITSGARANANTAYWIQFSGKNVQYYDGSAWVTVKTRDVFFTAWNAVRIVADVNTAEIYIGNELMGVAQRAGGSYGTTVEDTIDTVSFTCGASAATGGNCYIDNVKLCAESYDLVETPEPFFADNYNSYVVAAPIDGNPGYFGSYGASAQVDPLNPASKALCLVDSTDAAWPYYHYSFAGAKSANVEFDVYAKEGNIFTVQLLNGTRTYANTAYWLRFHTNGVYAYDYDAEQGKAAYKQIAETGFTLKQWNNIRIEATVGGEAQIYINDELVATVAAPDAAAIGADASVISSAYICVASSKVKPIYLDNIKGEGIVKGIPGLVETENGLKLEADVTVDELTVEAGKTLDLNGHTLTVKNLAAFGAIVDSSEDTAGKLVADSLDLNELAALPVAVEGGYKFFAYELKNLGIRTNADGSVKYGFAIDFANADAYALLAAADCGVDVTMTMAWGENSKAFAFSADFVKQYAALQVAYPNLDAAMILTVTGLDALESGAALSVTPAVNAAGATATSTAMVYTVG